MKKLVLTLIAISVFALGSMANTTDSNTKITKKPPTTNHRAFKLNQKNELLKVRTLYVFQTSCGFGSLTIPDYKELSPSQYVALWATFEMECW